MQEVSGSYSARVLGSTYEAMAFGSAGVLVSVGRA